ncbi:uncharacterized protein LOC114522210 [Dendronephthya gigantea]|uniref:uncharacterized protein LOC114522210 n=1 Tax=Dendronephthya gigantea TaxID=151771 RepID=UPI00106C12A0|nr:uncharacterized protein LOC114522210 [Dendronephthya gigantea]
MYNCKETLPTRMAVWVYRLAVLLSSVTLTLQHASFSADAKNIKVAHFFRLRDHSLRAPPLASLKISGNEMKCLTLSVKNENCYSLNARKQENEDVICELLNNTMYQHPNNLTRDESITHWFTKVPCVPSPCFKSYTTCIAKDSVLVPFACVYKWDYNFALRKPTAQSNVRFAGGVHLSSHYAVDGIKAASCLGDPETTGCAHLDTSHNQWWRVDLQMKIPVGRVGIANRKDWTNGLKNFEIKIGDSLENEGRNNPKCGDRHTVPHKEYKIISCSPPLSGRYVVIQGFDSSNLVIIEVEVFAAEVEVN